MYATATRTTVLPDPRPARGKHRTRPARGRALILSALTFILGGMTLTLPATANAAELTVTAPAAVPCQDQTRGLRILCNLPAIVAVTADAITPRAF